MDTGSRRSGQGEKGGSLGVYLNIEFFAWQNRLGSAKVTRLSSALLSDGRVVKSEQRGAGVGFWSDVRSEALMCCARRVIHLDRAGGAWR